MGRSDSKIAVVIPCYNEQATLAAVVTGAVPFGDVFVIDDGSTDASVQIAHDAGAQVVPTAGRTGYDGAIEAGLRHAHAQGYDFIITIDADGEHDPKLVRNLADAYRDGAQLVIGIRPAPQRLAEWIVCGYCRHAFGVNDVLCGMKGFARPVLDAYFADAHPNLVNTWPALLWAATHDVTQINVTGTPRTDQPRYSSRMRANMQIIKLLAPFRALRKRTR